MRIGIVCYPTFGGSGVVATELGMALAHKGHTVHFITYDRPVRLRTHPNVFYHEVRVSDYPLFDYQPYELVLTSKLVDVAKFAGLDILHVHYAIPHASAAWMAQRILAAEGIRLPFVTTLHGTDITLVGRDPSFEPVITFSMERSDAVTAVSQSLRRDTFEHFPLKPLADGGRDIDVIPNFICVDQYKHKPDTGLRTRYAPNGEKLLVHVSNFRPVKRVADVVKVFSNVRKQIPAKLLMIGDGPERQMAEDMAREAGIYHDIRFLGKQEQIGEILSISDLFLLPSATESFGLSALEAMACSVPVISSNAGGLSEINVQGKTGFLSDVGDVDDMTEKALYILKDDDQLKVFKKQALAHAKKFERQHIIPMYEKLYCQVVNNYRKTECDSVV